MGGLLRIGETFRHPVRLGSSGGHGIPTIWEG